MANNAVLDFYRAIFPNSENPQLKDPRGSVIVDGLLEGSRRARDLVNHVVQLEAQANLGNGFSASDVRQIIQGAHAVASEDFEKCGNNVYPHRIPPIPRPWPHSIFVNAPRPEPPWTQAEFNLEMRRQYKQGFALGYATELRSAANLVTNLELSKNFKATADQVIGFAV